MIKRSIPERRPQQRRQVSAKRARCAVNRRCGDRCKLIVALISALLVLASPAMVSAQEAAQGANDKAAAQALFDGGMRLFNEGSFAEACAQFEASLEVLEAMGTKGKLAECYEKVGRTASAWATYREVAVLAERSNQMRRKEIATERATRLEGLLAHLTIHVPKPVRVPGLSITRNGAPIGIGAFDVAIAVDPGPQTIVVSAQGHETWQTELVIEPSANESITIAALESVPTPMATTEARSEPVRTSSLKPMIGMSALGVGGASLIVSVVLGFKAKSDYDAAFDDGLCDDQGGCTDKGFTTTDDAKTLANVATGFGVAGLLLAGAGTYLWLSSRDESSTHKSLSITPTASTNTFGLSVGAEF